MALAARVCIFTGLVLAGFCVSSSAGDKTVIHIVPGPTDGVKIITPWGDYVAVQSGNSILVETTAEYMNGEADAVAAENGFRPVHIAGEGKNERNYVPADGLNAHIGNTALYSITPEIVIKKNSALFRLTWLQNNNTKITARLTTDHGATTYTPKECGHFSVFFYCDLTLPRSSLSVPVMAVFSAKGAKPAAISDGSVAQMVFNAIKFRYTVLLKDIAPDAETIALVNKLREVDPSVPDLLRQLAK